MTNFANKKINPFFNSFGCAVKGLRYVLRNERNFRLHIIISIFVLFTAFYLDFSWIDFALLIIVISIVLVAEMVNSAIEYTWDKLEPNHHPVVGIIKDTIAGSVLLASISAVAVGAIIIFKHFI